MLSNNQIKKLVYGIMVLIILILLVNIYLTKINNNYDDNIFEISVNSNKVIEGLENNNSLETTLSSYKENVKKFDSKNLEIFKKILVLNEAEYLNDTINENSKTRLDMKNLLNNDKFKKHISDVDDMFKYVDYLLDNFDKSKK